MYAKRIILAVGFLLSIGLAGCATSGHVEESQKLKGSLKKYESVYIDVSAKKSEYKKHSELLQKALSTQLANPESGKSPFQEIFVDPAEEKNSTLKIKLTITGFEGGSSGARLLGFGGEAKIVGKGEILDLKSKKILGKFLFDGSSLNEGGRVTMGGIPIGDDAYAGEDKLTVKAINSAATYITKYICEREE